MREARPGDRYLLCSDGLSGVVSDDTLAATLRGYADPRECADRLIDLALRGGGPDNITCIVADVVDIDFGDDAPIVGGAAGDGRDIAPPPDSAAARASAATLTRTAPLVHVSPAPSGRAGAARARHGRLRVALGVLAVLAVLVGGGVLARTWVLQQFYVGAADGRVAIFQGVRGTVLGLPLQQVVERSDIALTDLPEATRGSVEDGLLVAEGGLPGARTRVAMLRDSMLVPCSALVPPAAPPSVAPEAAPTVPVDPSAAVQTLSPVPPGGATVAPPAPAPTLGSDTTPLPPLAPEPGRNCRQGS